ncbi:hypothetical protein OH76DRAFT_1407968 [Lentinus brumalis]|uniref:Protein CPL1-like domain-containing protein n=1 Tax=Lentinus brumalis TaxID=2498619 RepID=A0A371CZ59_9APHY|nr:hypothetical protein OH76DRAFT_1407968 [Polyporus brumalis]
MRAFGFSTLAILGLAAGSVDARAYTPRSSRALGGLLARQTTSDTCANVNGVLKVNVQGSLVSIGQINACLCLSTVPTFLSTNAVAISTVSLVGTAAATSAVVNLITSSPSSQVCTYPEHAIPMCAAGNPCGFSCGNGFSTVPATNPSTCACVAPGAVCNGVCTTSSCPSSVVTATRRRYMNSLRKRAMCPEGTTACGVYERRGALSTPWECIDTMSDLESCGGCINPLDAFSTRGVDCTAIPGVIDVSCVSGACVVNRCGVGYTRTSDGSSCASAMLEQD